MKEQIKVFCGFLRATLKYSLTGSIKYHLWMGVLTVVMILGAFFYSQQVRHGLIVTGMNDYVSWGLYISNFTFLVGIAAAAVMLVLPAYILSDKDFYKVVLIGEGIAVGALLMCLAFVTVDIGGPQKVWHLIPGIGILNWPESMLAWDVIVLNGYLALNILIPFYILFSKYKGLEPKKKFYLPFVFLSVFWAISIHMVTAFLYAGLPARPFWNNSLLGPRFLASAFSAGPAFILIVLGIIRRYSAYEIAKTTLDKIALIVAVAAQINLVMLGSEIFKELYSPTQHSISTIYLFFGVGSKNALVPWVWTSIVMNILATLVLTIHRLRSNLNFLFPACALLFVSIWIEKGLGLVIPGFIPSPLGEFLEYSPTLNEIGVTIGIWAFGFFVLSVLIRLGIAIELGYVKLSTALIKTDKKMDGIIK